MLKVTLKICLILVLGCNAVDEERELEAFEQQLNIEAEKTIDAAYIVIKHQCDSLMSQKKMMYDSIKSAGNKRL